MANKPQNKKPSKNKSPKNCRRMPPADTAPQRFISPAVLPDTNASGAVFDIPVLCAQFLRGYVDYDIFKDITPQDIVDVTEQFLPASRQDSDADSVKKIYLSGNKTAFLLTILAHHPKVDYTVCMKILRYFVFIWTRYEEECEKLHPGTTKNSEFSLPPIIPVLYYEGAGKWKTAAQLQNAILMNDTFSKYIPNFTYEVITRRDYEDKPVAKEDELSLLMLFHRMLASKDYMDAEEIPQGYLDNMHQKSPEYLLRLIGRMASVFLRRGPSLPGMSCGS